MSLRPFRRGPPCGTVGTPMVRWEINSSARSPFEWRYATRGPQRRARLEIQRPGGGPRNIGRSNAGLCPYARANRTHPCSPSPRSIDELEDCDVLRERLFVVGWVVPDRENRSDRISAPHGHRNLLVGRERWFRSSQRRPFYESYVVESDRSIQSLTTGVT